MTADIEVPLVEPSRTRGWGDRDAVMTRSAVAMRTRGRVSVGASCHIACSYALGLRELAGLLVAGFSVISAFLV